uniref:Major sperm protein n=1 Tax=Panagrolaimus superbus TaxID=310955 RepID=A0A914YSV4_9BILA
MILQIKKILFHHFYLKQTGKIGGSGSPIVKAPRFVQVDPTQLKFQLCENGPAKKTLQLTNVCGLRIAWRIRSNAPTRYVVNPACGFLTNNEAQTIQIELSDSNKYSERHRFMVQAMEAKDDEKDRRKIWEDNRATQLDLVQCFRVFTIGIGAVSEQSFISIISKTLCTPGAGAAASIASSDGVTTTTSVTSSAPSSTSATTSSGTSTTGSEASSVATGATASAAASLSEYSDRIGELTVLAKNSLAAKEQVSQQMVRAVNEVKRIEVELDRAGQQSSELDGRQKSLAAQVEQLEKRTKQLDDELKAALGAKENK